VLRVAVRIFRFEGRFGFGSARAEGLYEFANAHLRLLRCDALSIECYQTSIKRPLLGPVGGGLLGLRRASQSGAETRSDQPVNWHGQERRFGSLCVSQKFFDRRKFRVDLVGGLGSRRRRPYDVRIFGFPWFSRPSSAVVLTFLCRACGESVYRKYGGSEGARRRSSFVIG